jgi:hypothetical protein
LIPLLPYHSAVATSIMNPDQLNHLSEQLLLHVKLGKDTSAIQRKLEESELISLKKSLVNDDKKKAFWINIYNAYYQILRQEKKIVKPAIYKQRLIKISGKSWSLDDVEHGILRRFRYKYSLGFFANVMASKFIKEHAVDQLDYRIHFALNCGAKSCPPIAFYHSGNIHAQLDLATQSFLEGESDFDDENKVVRTSALFKWFYADFGGKNGIKRIFAERLNKEISDYKIKYKDYSWEDDLANFVEEDK